MVQLVKGRHIKLFHLFHTCPQPGNEHPRLTERLRAMSESRAEVSQHTVKMNFINKVNKSVYTTVAIIMQHCLQFHTITLIVNIQVWRIHCIVIYVYPYRVNTLW